MHKCRGLALVLMSLALTGVAAKAYAAEPIGLPPIITGGAVDLDLASLAFSSFAPAIRNSHSAGVLTACDLGKCRVPGYCWSQEMVPSPDEWSHNRHSRLAL